MEKIRILLAEDDPNLGEILKEYLEVKGYEVSLAFDGEAGYTLYKKEPYDLCILDVMMPKMDGFALAEKIRRADNGIPILFVTAKSLKEDTLQGFAVGADDYVTKPFSMEELLVRIKAVLRRTIKYNELRDEQTRFSIGDFQFDADAQKLTHRDGTEFKLTSNESGLLKMLCQSRSNILDRSEALKKIWLDDNYFNSRSMDVYITKLRKFLKKDERIQIVNVHGQGFKLVELKD